MFLSYFLYLNALFAQSLFVYDAVMLALLQIFKLPFGSQISNCPNFINPTSMTTVFSGNGSYVIQKDGIYEITLSGVTGYDCHVYLNGFTILYASNSGNMWRNDTVSFPLKAGATLTMDAYGTMNVRLFE